MRAVSGERCGEFRSSGTRVEAVSTKASGDFDGERALFSCGKQIPGNPLAMISNQQLNVLLLKKGFADG